jgi:hypothetical protein
VYGRKSWTKRFLLVVIVSSRLSTCSCILWKAATGIYEIWPPNLCFRRGLLHPESPLGVLHDVKT